MTSPFPGPAAPGSVPADQLAAVEELHAVCRRWCEHIPQHRPYADLAFAFGFAVLGDPTRTRRLLADAWAVMHPPVPPPPTGDPKASNPLSAGLVPRFAYRAFEYRVEQALAGQPLAGPLPADLRAMLEDIEREAGRGPVNSPHNLAVYHIARLREQSCILEPDELIDPYFNTWYRHRPGAADVRELLAARERGQADEFINRLFREAAPESRSALGRLAELTRALLRGGEHGPPADQLDLVIAVLRHATGELDGDGPKFLLGQQCGLLARGLRVARGRVDQTRALAQLLADLAVRFPEEARFQIINTAGWTCLRNLRVLGLWDEIDRLLTWLGVAIPDLRPSPGNLDAVVAYYQSRLVLAAGWLMLGRGDEAAPALDEGRRALFGPDAPRVLPTVYTDLARAYVSALGQWTADTGLPRVAELFRDMEPGKITNFYTTAASYSRFHLNLTEDAVAAACWMLLEPPP